MGLAGVRDRDGERTAAALQLLVAAGGREAERGEDRVVQLEPLVAQPGALDHSGLGDEERPGESAQPRPGGVLALAAPRARQRL